MKKNLLTTAIVGILICGSFFCTAAVSPDVINIGGIAPGSTIESAKAKFGQPNQSGDDLYFSNGVHIEFEKYNPNIVDEIEITTPGVSTSKGITIGSPEAKVKKVYGQPDKVEMDDGKTEYTYYSTDYSKKMEFEVVNGSIVKIKCQHR